MVKPGQRWIYRHNNGSWFIVEATTVGQIVTRVGRINGIIAKVVQVSQQRTTRFVGEVCDNLSLEYDGPDFQDKDGASWALLEGQEAPNG